MEVIVLERLKKRAHPKLLEFVKSHFKYGTNFRCSVIKGFLERFDQGWARKFQDFIDSNEEAVVLVESAYTIRNQAAHGNSVNVGEKRLGEFFSGAKIVVEAVIRSTA